jgi:dolichol-phosphate mannosyltransferase
MTSTADANTGAPDRPLICLPTYNEKDNLARMVETIRTATAGLSRGGRPFTILILDDNSPDGTGKIADDLAAKHPGEVLVEHRPGKAGLGRAYIAGFKRAMAEGFDPVFEMDCDFSHPAEALPRMLELVQTHDLALGCRYMKGGATPDWPPRRRALSVFANMYANLATGHRVRDLTGGFKCFRAHTLRAVPWDEITSEGYGFQVEVTDRVLRAGLKIVETPIVFRDRTAGVSKISKHIIYEALWLVFRMLIGRVGMR